MFIFADNPNRIAIDPATANKMGHIFGLFHFMHGIAIYNNTAGNHACQELPNYQTSNVCNYGITGNAHATDLYKYYTPDAKHFMSFSIFDFLAYFSENQINKSKYFIQEQPLAHLLEVMCLPYEVYNNTAIIEGLLQSTTKYSDACGL